MSPSASHSDSFAITKCSFIAVHVDIESIILKTLALLPKDHSGCALLSHRRFLVMLSHGHDSDDITHVTYTDMATPVIDTKRDECRRQRDQAQQKDALELELIALKKSMAGAPGRGSPGRRGSQVMLGGAEGIVPGSPSQQTSATAAAAEVKADRLARELEEAEEEISAMSSKIKQQVNWAHFAA